MRNWTEFIEKNTIRCEAGYRGGGIEIGLSDLFPTIDDPRITAYQNYLGGDLLGRICNSASFEPSNLSKKNQKIFSRVCEELKKYFHNLTNHEGDEWEEESYQENQLRKPVSAY